MYKKQKQNNNTLKALTALAGKGNAIGYVRRFISILYFETTGL